MCNLRWNSSLNCIPPPVTEKLVLGCFCRLKLESAPFVGEKFNAKAGILQVAAYLGHLDEPNMISDKPAAFEYCPWGFFTV